MILSQHNLIPFTCAESNIRSVETVFHAESTNILDTLAALEANSSILPPQHLSGISHVYCTLAPELPATVEAASNKFYRKFGLSVPHIIKNSQEFRLCWNTGNWESKRPQLGIGGIYAAIDDHSIYMRQGAYRMFQLAQLLNETNHYQILKEMTQYKDYFQGIKQQNDRLVAAIKWNPLRDPAQQSRFLTPPHIPNDFEFTSEGQALTTSYDEFSKIFLALQNVELQLNACGYFSFRGLSQEQIHFLSNEMNLSKRQFYK